MERPRLADMKGKWVPAIGWAIFIGLVVALMADRYIFNPFLFGFAYYTIYVLTTSPKEDPPVDASTLKERLMIVCIIALIYLWSAFNTELRQRNFVRDVEMTCYGSDYGRSPAGERVCEEIQSHIDNVLHKPDDGYDDRDF